MNDLPRRPIEPLPPPPGQFDAVVARARYRRHRRLTTVLTVTTVFMAGVAGGLSLSGTGVQDRFIDIATRFAATQTPSSTATPTPDATAKDRERTTRAPSPSARRSTPTRESSAPAVQSPAAPLAALAVHGRAVTTAGDPVAGLYVYPGRPRADGFVPASRPADRTAADGTFTLDCTGTPVLLSPWLVNAPAPEAGSATWAATFVGGVTDAASAANATCNRSGRVTDTIVQPGSAVEGTVEVPGDCADQTHSLWLWLHNDRGLTVRIQDLGQGDTFRVAGLPPGQHTVGANGNRSTVIVGGGETLTRDVTFRCDTGTPTEPPVPTPSPTAPPAPAPTEPTSPASTPSATSTSTPPSMPTPTSSVTG